jgi:divalent metal cation (Fe/Co/Zn/Cd) transporter
MLLAVFTIVYNILEGMVATYFGYGDESLALFGFGIDSYIEAISGLGVAHMVFRIRTDPAGNRDRFERTAVTITGYAFFALTAGLIVTGLFNLATAHRPATTFWGVLISVASIGIMWALIIGKRKVGGALQSDAILADAQCTKVCIYMSLVLLASSAIYELTHVPYVDALGTLGLAVLSFREGRECIRTVRSDRYCGCTEDGASA